MLLLALFADMAATAELFRTVRWANGLFCPRCGGLKKHRGVSKWHLEQYVKSFQFVHNHRHYGINGRFVAALAAILDQYPRMQV